MKRVILFKNGTDTDGKVFLVTHSMEELLTAASQKFKVNAKRLFTPQGGELDDLKLIRDDDVLYVSAGESFIPLQPCLASKKNDTLLPATSSTATSSKDWVTLNVGGKYFTTSRSTLVSKEPLSMLARMFAEGENGYLMTPSNVDHNGAYLIDRSPTYFEPILNYLRNGQLIFDTNVNPEGVLEEARFFGLESLVPQLEAMITSNQRSRDNLPLSRRDVINALVCTPFTAELRFQGVNLAGSDLSRLDLRYINFKYACLHGCRMVGANLSWCCLERADLSHAQLEGAHLLGVKMLCANLEGANLRGCNFEDPAGSRANMEGVNLKGANLEGSNMAGVNLRVATLKNANLQNCDLRAAVLAGADLENCDLSGSDLNEANLRGANLKGAAFELMLTPLHMSQAIR
ncbi:BTB/POZ domain-containing protein KCTD9 isoform X1 [Frankliniella occidentalis]|uniref:BTB/POZ domain-containing protein KCTD9 isoform X1 n=1 Tax=Frankliniella occidentalis TaxID=133901 RepID=A0A6J1SZB3_FRAOC|nr:BTB/POZ domain-containing protein KCTD9 isoform X1 [Frankliniella occidentalis]